MKNIIAFISTLIPLALFDAFWFFVVSKNFYKEALGNILTSNVNFVPVLLFYPIYAFAILVLVVMPAVDRGLWTEALWKGAVLGLAAYSAYDLTNQATISLWPPRVTFIDIAWGIIMTALVSTITYFIIIRFK